LPDDLLKRWDTLSDEEKKLFIRQANVYAAYLAYTDHERSSGKAPQARKLAYLQITLIRPGRPLRAAVPHQR